MAARALVPIRRAGGVVKGWWDGLEGSWRGPLFGMGELGGWFTLGRIEDGWQRNLKNGAVNGRAIPAAYAAVMASARAISQCYPTHKTVSPTGIVSVVTTSAASRIFRSPNAYETWPQFILNLVAGMGFEGESFAVAFRNDRSEITELHRMPMRTTSPLVTPDGAIFYAIGPNPMLPEYTDWVVPARDVLHLRANCPRHPLIGETDLAAAMMAAGVNVSLSGSQLAFFTRMSRPSGILSTEQALTKVQLAQLREAWKEQSTDVNQGGIGIVAGGLKFQPLTITSQDAQLIEAQRLSIEDIARVYGVPLPVIGDLSHATLQNTEQLIQHWLSVSLGAQLENIEQSFNALFGFGPRDYCELNTAALLRADFEKRIEGYTRAIQGALMMPNEARTAEGLSPVPDGDRLYAQAQIQPLGTPTPDPAASASSTPAATPAQGDTPAAPPDEPTADNTRAAVQALAGLIARNISP